MRKAERKVLGYYDHDTRKEDGTKITEEYEMTVATASLYHDDVESARLTTRVGEYGCYRGGYRAVAHMA